VNLPLSTRLNFRPYTREDLPALRAVFSDRYSRLFYPEHDDDRQILRWIDWNLRNYEQLGFGLWALEAKGTRLFVGDAGLTLQTVEGSRVLEVGYHIHLDLRSKGLAREAAAVCIDWAFENTSHEMVCSIVDPRNVASIAVARKLHRSERQFQGRTGSTFMFYTTRDQGSAA
jgi:[ribosomal protein S5]-alanine N-acetyltransferase